MSANNGTAGGIIITKGKILKGGDEVLIEYTKTDPSGQKASVEEKHSAKPHDDLKNTFHSLAAHAGICGGFIPSKNVKSIAKINVEDISSFNVSGFTIVGDDEGVIITAQKSTTYGSTNFNTPTIRFMADGDKAYAFIDDLETAIDKVKQEFSLYLEGKTWVDPQGEFFPKEG